MTMDDDTRAREQAQAQLDNVRALIARWDCAQAGHDPDACPEAVECTDCEDGTIQVVENGEIVTEECPTCAGHCRTWDTAAHDGLMYDEYHDEDQASEAISEDALQVLIRSDWTTPGADMEPAEYVILLCTGGPAVRIHGDLNEYGEPDRAWLEHQDWGEPWQEFAGDNDQVAARGDLVTYSAQFLYGE